MAASPTRLAGADPIRPIRVERLRVELSHAVDVIDHVSFEVAAGEVLGVVGESGSGKTTLGSALLAHARRGAAITSGTVEIDGNDLLAVTPTVVQSHRGRTVAFVPQDPGTALNPSLRIGRQLGELFAVHEPGLGADERRMRIGRALADVRLPVDREFLGRFPHQLSGGQQQRICIAMAFLLDPAVIVFDEPTTGLDVTTQAAILDIIRRLCRERGVAAVYISHDLAVVSSLADRVMVMYAGRVVESGPTGDLLEHPSHPYTSLLADAIPDVRHRKLLRPIPGQAPAPDERPDGCAFTPRCPLAVERCHVDVPTLRTHGARGRQVACHRPGEVTSASPDPEPAPHRSAAPVPVLTVVDLHAGYGGRAVLSDISLTLDRSECLAVVGESGSGKTTLARTIAGLVAPSRGHVLLDGEPLASPARRRTARQRQLIQYVFQNPYASFNPRSTIASSLTSVIRHFGERNGKEVDRRAAAALEAVSLPVRLLAAFPDQLSGGERQRAAVARALVCDPAVLICDEITSALDVSVQAAIVRLLQDIQRDRGLSLLFVTHDLALVRSVAHRVVVVSDGRIVEVGDVDAVLDEPQHPYTRQLVEHSPHMVR